MALSSPSAPYRLHNAIQPYSWGARGPEAFIPRLLGIPAAPHQPYAELWIGTHPNAPSHVTVGGERVSLAELVAAHPGAILGQAASRRFENSLPFLFKVLSADEALSIQAHPNKVQAQRLHARDPEHYPDANHKPEVAIALDALTALAGLKSADELRVTLATYPEIAAFIEGDGSAAVPAARDSYTALLRRALAGPEALIAASQRLAARLAQATRPLTEIESLFLKLREVYTDADVGLFSLFLLNLVHLQAGEGLYIPAGVPHAYLKGNIVECMANSDNVVRAGLTSKFKDAEALLEILAHDAVPLPILRPHEDAGETRYLTPAEEFEMRRLTLETGASREMTGSDSVEVALIIEGSLRIVWPGGAETYRRGESFLIPACQGAWQLTALEATMLFRVVVPG